ncbi:MAG: hypothetical protein JJ840_07545 [Prochlorococcus marinus CUG1431]|uniref:Uncharacterized protein n=1 Tax=Prochlorococcus marinus CUG1433 TaxID=2774506 RepID=A0A9D9FYN4_PROMR|nr:hypothetical protein [Prochlorococcus marinus CUG1433]MBO6981200.1 hypothetical protein [Prochlorococcus marinus CUG1431]
MKQLNPDIFLWASPLFCKDPEKSSYEYSLLNPLIQKRKIIYSFIFFTRSFYSGLKKISKRKIFKCNFFNSGPRKNIVYLPGSFINNKEKNCPYFPSATNETSFLIIDNESKLSRNFLKICFKLFLFILPEFIRFNKKNNILDRFVNWILLLSYFVSLDALTHYYFALYIYDLSISYPKANHICLHEMHSYSRIVYGVTSITRSNSTTLQHAFIHPTRLMFDLRNIKIKPYLPVTIFVWSEESRNVLFKFGWPAAKIKFCATERFLRYKELSMNSDLKESSLFLNYLKNPEKEEIFLFIPSLLKDDFKLCIISALILRSIYKDIKIMIKIHPSYKLSFIESLITLYLSLKSIKYTKSNLNDLFKKRPLTFTYSSTAIFEAALNKCPSYFIPTSLKYNGNELVLRNILLKIADQYKKGKILEQSSNPLYISAERSNSFFGLDRNNFFTIIDR